MNNNIKSNQILCNLVLPEMIKREDGCIIISSIAAIKVVLFLELAILVRLLMS